MLREIPRVRQIPGEPYRRWFCDEDFDLIVWLEGAAIVGFQLSYNKNTPSQQRALTWKRDLGYTHDRVDDGENRPGSHKSTPILVPDGLFSHQQIAQQFAAVSDEVDTDIAAFVYTRLMAYPGKLV